VDSCRAPADEDHGFDRHQDQIPAQIKDPDECNDLSRRITAQQVTGDTKEQLSTKIWQPTDHNQYAALYYFRKLFKKCLS